MPDRTCTVRGCGKGPVVALDMCRKHLSRYYRLGDPRPDLDEPRACAGCAEAFTPSRTDQKYCTQACLSRATVRRRMGLVEVISPVRPCEWCETKFRSEDGRRLYCSEECRRIGASLQEHPLKYGVTIRDYRRLFVAQGGRCGSCGGEQSPEKLILCLDHCHATGKVRGLLCSNCNRAIGLMKDDPRILRAAADYLEAAS
jgi:hypothetical protein